MRASSSLEEPINLADMVFGVVRLLGRAKEEHFAKNKAIAQLTLAWLAFGEYINLPSDNGFALALEVANSQGALGITRARATLLLGLMYLADPADKSKEEITTLIRNCEASISDEALKKKLLLVSSALNPAAMQPRD